MKVFLFQDYFSSEEKFQSCERFWDEEFLKITTEAGVSEDWTSFGTAANILQDGTVLSPVTLAMEFNALPSILRKVSPKWRKVLFVFQIDAMKYDLSRLPSNYKFVEHWTEVLDFHTGFTEGDVDILRIRVVLTDKSLQDVRSLIRDWVMPKHAVT
jgi:hypothetical protein